MTKRKGKWIKRATNNEIHITICTYDKINTNMTDNHNTWYKSRLAILLLHPSNLINQLIYYSDSGLLLLSTNKLQLSGHLSNCTAILFTWRAKLRQRKLIGGVFVFYFQNKFYFICHFNIFRKKYIFNSLFLNYLLKSKIIN